MSPVPVHINIYGPCMSGGSIILQVAKKRRISQNSRVTGHYGFTEDEGTSNPKRLGSLYKEHKQLTLRVVDIYLLKAKKVWLIDKNWKIF
mgnify:CR=1 FL=1